jgi:hypothetical protein
MSEHSTPEEIGDSIFQLVFQAGHTGATTIVRPGKSNLSIRDWVVDPIRKIETKAVAAEDVVQFARVLTERLDEIFSDPEYQAVFKTARDQGHAYMGPNCDSELNFLEMAIAAYDEAL